jgi:two-component system chemotaxis response regulator CheB
MRRLISDIITSDPAMTVETAINGRDALDKIERFRPDVVTLDIEMPVMDGLEALEAIMKTSRGLPVLILSSAAQESADKTFRALRLGAVDFISKPSGPISPDLADKKDELLGKIRMAAGPGRGQGFFLA